MQTQGNGEMVFDPTRLPYIERLRAYRIRPFAIRQWKRIWKGYFQMGQTHTQIRVPMRRPLLVPSESLNDLEKGTSSTILLFRYLVLNGQTLHDRMIRNDHLAAIDLDGADPLLHNDTVLSHVRTISHPYIFKRRDEHHEGKTQGPTGRMCRPGGS